MPFSVEITTEELRKQLENFSNTTANLIQGFYNKNAESIEIGEPKTGLEIDSDFIGSIYFVGTVFGEFVIGINRADAKEILSMPEQVTTEEDSLGDSICELLNMAAGASIKLLLEKFDKVTIAAPRLYNGSLRYRGVKASCARIRYGKATINLALYIDTMRLDIASSYSENMHKLKEMNQSLLDANEKLKAQQAQLVHSEKMASLGTMAAGVAHEINNPLAYVLSNTDVLSTYVEAFQKLFDSYHRLAMDLTQRKSKEALADLKAVQSLEKENDVEFIIQDTLNLIQESKSGLDRIREIVSGLKRFSRVDDSGMKFVKINDEIKNTLQLLSHELKYRAKLTTKLSSSMDVRCAPGEMGQVFVNLIMNAVQALPETGGEITISTEDRSDHLMIHIADSGCGISNENLEKIFNPFFTTKPVGKGTGLGLSISHGIIQKHGGTITVASEVGKGTIFTIRLPFVSE